MLDLTRLSTNDNDLKYHPQNVQHLKKTNLSLTFRTDWNLHLNYISLQGRQQLLE